MAGLYVAGPGTLLANLSVVAGNNLNIIGATVQGAGTTELIAANSVNLGTLQISQSNNVGAGDAKNHLLTSQTSDVGSTVSAGQNLTITAGQNIIAKAADLQAQGDVSLAAQGTVLLHAGQTRSSYDAVLTTSSSDLISTTTTRTQTQASAATAQVSQVQGQNVSIVAGQDLISVGTQFKGTDSLRVEGQDTSTFYAATDVHQSTTTVQSSTSMLGFKLEDKTISDSLATSTSIGSTLLSDQKIEIGVGNKTELQGATVEAQQIAFVQTDPTKAGELILGGSIDTTQTSHTEKTETLGLYQEMKGHGSTVETLNQTTLKGNVSFDAALKITVQIPDTKGGQALKSQIHALVTQTGGTGLEYLNQLAADPNIQWDKVALANEHWSYDQAGLTPAGAALLSIAVAAYAPGLSSGITNALGGGSIAVGVNAGFIALQAQAAVAMVNNKGDIGKTLEQLGSEQSIKGLLTTMLTAGALDKLNASYFAGVDATSTFGTQLLKNVTNNLASSAMDAAINGKAFNEAAISKALSSALVTTGMAQGAFAIGEARGTTLNDFTATLAHAVLGCAGGAAIAGNGSGCAPGAVGAVVGELTAEYAKENGLSPTQSAQLGKVLSAVSGVLVGGGGDNAQAVNIANTTGANAIDNNLMRHLSKMKEGCGLTGCSAAELALANGRNVGRTAILSSGAMVQLVEGTDGVMGVMVTAKGQTDPVIMDATAYAAFSKLTPDQQKDLLNSSDWDLQVANAKIVTSTSFAALWNGWNAYRKDIGNSVVNVGVAIIKNGPNQNSPQDMPWLDDGRPPASGGTAPVTAGAAILICEPPICVWVPTVVTMPGSTGLTYSQSNEGGDNASSGANGNTADNLPSGAMQNPVQQQQTRAPDFTPRSIRTAANAIDSGNGVPRIDPATNAQTVFQGREPASAWWKGALEFDVPGSGNQQRILVKTLPDGTTVKGYVDNHNYNIIKLLPSTPSK